jgi:hypothetical protein
VAKRLTDVDKKKIIADYVQYENYAEVGRKWGISGNHVKNLVRAAPDISDKFTQKKEKNTLDVLAYLDSKTDSLKRLGDYILDVRLDPVTKKDELDKMALSQLVQVFGVFTDKMLKSKEISSRTKGEGREIEDLSPLVRLLKRHDENTDN